MFCLVVSACSSADTGVRSPIAIANELCITILAAPSLLSYARQIVAKEGLVKGLWSPGVGANMMSFFVCGGLRQGLYPWFRDTLVVAYAPHCKRLPAD